MTTVGRKIDLDNFQSATVRTARDINRRIVLNLIRSQQPISRADLARHGWKVDYIAVRNGIGLRIPHPEGFDHPNLLIVLGAATLGTTRLIDNVDVIKKDGED